MLLFRGWFLAPLANDEKQSCLNSNQITVMIKLTGGASEYSELSPKIISNQDQLQMSTWNIEKTLSWFGRSYKLSKKQEKIIDLL